MNDLKLQSATYRVLLQSAAQCVLQEGVHETAKRVRAKGIELDRPEATPPSRSLASRANLIAAAKRHFADKKERAEIAGALGTMATAQAALADGEVTSNIHAVLQDLIRLESAATVLRGTELEGLLPQGFVDQLRERWFDVSSRAASQYLARLSGKGTTGILIEPYSKQNFTSALHDLADRLQRAAGLSANEERTTASDVRSVLGAIREGVPQYGPLKSAGLEQAIENARSVLAHKEMIRGIDVTLLRATISVLGLLAGFATAYPQRKLPEPKLEDAQRVVMWNSTVGVFGPNMADLQLAATSQRA